MWFEYYSEDGLIHCFKEGEPCQNGREQLITLTRSILSQIPDVDEADNAVFRIEEDDEIIDVNI